MLRVHTTSALIVVLMLGLATAANAAHGPFGNMCTWGLANHKDVQTDCSVNATFRVRPTVSAARTLRASSWRIPVGI